MKTTDLLLEDFTDARFQAAFRLYYAELGVTVKDWDRLFQKMNQDPHGKDYAYIRVTEADQIVGFLQFTTLDVSSWFFKTQLGFVREFWVDPAYRSRNFGTELLQLTEDHFRRQGLFASILTTDTAEGFYQKRGYVRVDAIVADNDETVLVKVLNDVTTAHATEMTT